MSTATMTQPETRIKVDNERVDRLKEQHISTPQRSTTSASGSWRRCTRKPPATSRSSAGPSFWRSA